MSSIQLTAKIENMEMLVQSVSSVAGNLGFTAKRIREIELAVEEALVNIINYAYPNGEGDIKVTCTREDSRALVIEIEDTGVAFDLMLLKEPDISADISERQVGGLGIFLIRKLMNEVKYRRKHNRNVLTLVAYPSDRT